MFGVTQQQGDLDDLQASVAQIGGSEFVPDEVQLAAKIGAGLGQVALKRARRAIQRGADSLDVRFSIAQRVGNGLADALDNFFLLRQLRRQRR